MPPEIDGMQLLNTITEIRVELGKLSTRLEKLDDFTRSLNEQRDQVTQLGRKASELADIITRINSQVEYAHQRINSVTKVAYTLLTAFLGTTVAAIVGFALKGGFIIQ